MALLKFRQISLADWQTLEVKDPDTRYIVYNEDESIYGEFIGEEKVTKEVEDLVDNKVDKVSGKSLSTNDFTDLLKIKLDGIEAGAEVNVQSDWTQEVNTADDYIKNKPAIPTKTSDLTNDTGYITGYTETDPIFTAWDKTTGISITKSQITDLIEATQAISGLMSATDKQRLDVLHALLEEDTANNVVDSINEILAIFNNYPEGADLVSALANKVDKNDAITAGTKAKITYDSKGLVTSGADLVASDIPSLSPSKITQDANNRFVTDTEKSTWNSKQATLVSGTNIKTINNQSILGSGNIEISGGSGGEIAVETWDTATKTLALSDTNKLFKCSHTDNQTLTIPTNATAAFPIGTMITFLLTSTYTVTFSGASGVTLTSIDSLVELATQFAMASLIKTDTNTWQLVGALE